ncbi:MAG: hypothetical protein HZA34_00925 [Candidatus Pacebacteria bacterium]|nr:hypothetical protein [Candidatus Paceibacterota bacterium]
MANYSRLSKFEQQKIARQSVTLLFFTVVIISLFIFVIMPASTRIFELFSPKKQSSLIPQESTLPPQVPILFSLPEATNSAELAVSGYGEADTKVTLFNNGTRVQEVTVDKGGQFSFGYFTLSEGDNLIFVRSRNTQNAESNSKQYTAVFDVKPPTLTISEPADGFTVTRKREQVVTVKGQTESKTRVYLNDRLLFTDNQANFSGTYQLAEGDNILTVRAVDTAGNVAEKQIKVSYRP